MKLLTTLFFVITLTTLQAQNTLEVVKKSFNDGLPEIVNYYNNDETQEHLTGIRHYNRDGKITYSASYENGLQHGKTVYYDNYSFWISKELNYEKGLLNGVQVGYFRENEKQFEYFYKNGKLDGTQREWHPNGKQKSEWQIENGVLNDVQKFWDSYETESKDEVFENGLLAENRYHSNKKLVKKFIYKTEVTDKDFVIGYDKTLIEELIFYENEQLKTHTIFGEFEAFTHYYKNGNTKGKGKYDSNRKTGLWEYWSEDGKKTEAKTYKNNILNGAYSVWYENEQLKEQGEYTEKRKSGQWNFWYENGQKSAEGGFEESTKTGNWTYWKENGQQVSFGAYKKGREQGVWQYWNDKEQIVEERTFDYGNLQKWKVFFYNGNGQITEAGFLDEKGNKAELWEYWFENKGKKRVEKYKTGPYYTSRPFIENFEEWYPNGQLKQKGNDKEYVEYTYFDNKKIATEKYFIQQKNHKRYEYYEDGIIKKQLNSLNNEGGDLINREVVERMLAKAIEYYENGNEKSLTQYCKNCKSVPAEALEKLNNTTGKICKTCPAYTKAYRNLEEPVYNLKQGEFKEWFENGQLKIKVFYAQNCIKGNVEEYYQSGELMLSIVISEHPNKSKLNVAIDCMPLMVSGTFYDEKGKDYIYVQRFKPKSVSKAAKNNDYSLLEAEEKPRKVQNIMDKSYFFQTFLSE